MFKRTFNFWRRLVGKSGPAPHVNGSAGDERRLWIRYPADLRTRVELHRQTPPVKLTAKIRDLSRGGANLLLDHEVQLGQVIHLELPSPDDGDYTIVACVVRAEREANGRWALGCVFSRELSDDDLHALGASRVRHAPEDKRTWRRFPSALRATVRQVGATGSPRSVEVLNLSASGIGLLLDDPIESGALLNVELTVRNAHGAKVAADADGTGDDLADDDLPEDDLADDDVNGTRTILACVVHVHQREDGKWTLGCNFIRELSEEDLRALV